MTPISAEMKSIEVALIEDRDDMRAQLSHTLACSGSLRLIEAFNNGEAALARLPGRRPHVVLVDINLPGINGVECVRQLKPKLPETQFVMLTIYEDIDRLFESLTAGASGYLLKRTPAQTLVAAIREVHSGGVPITPEMARRMIRHFRGGVQTSPELESLTTREYDVLRLLGKGYLYKEIEDELKISPGTMRTYVASIYKKLHVHSRTEAVLKYLNPGNRPS